MKLTILLWNNISYLTRRSKSWLSSSCFGPQGKEKLSTRSSKTFWWIWSRDTSREIQFSFKAITRLPSVKWIHLLRSIFKAHGQAHICVSIVTPIHVLHFPVENLTGSSSLILIITSRGKKRDTLNNIDDEYPRRSFIRLTRIKIGLIAWNIYTDISNIDEKYENLYLLFQKNFECMLNNSF